MSKPDIAPPKSKTRASFLGRPDAAPSMDAAANNMKAEKWADLNFKVSPDFHRKFKSTAVTSGMSMKELLEEAYNAWVDKQAAK